MKTAVVTGGAGFIGSHLVGMLIRRNVDVHVIDNLSTGHKEKVPQEAAFYEEDIRSDKARDLIRDIGPDAVIHLAAQADVGQSVNNPCFDMDVNVRGTINLLEACRLASVRKFIFASTSGVYGDLDKEILTELDPVKPISFYGLSKLAAEHYIRMYDKFFDIPYTILRFANVYGPGQNAHGEGGVIAIFMDRISKGLSLPVNGDGMQTRDFVYVEDVAEAIAAAVQFGNRDTIHVSTGVKTSINQLIQLLGDIHPYWFEVTHRPARPGDIMHSCLSNLKARNHLQWNPVHSVRSGLEKTYSEWLSSPASNG
ncbi:NAD-dependent epimerase/dehydratase family protein [Paenibacillus sp. M1]|uniref:NAD-dependent epimerase/dehydratase family protein n=1 Tax=Paenibacillus haidiansis TaxID=1574488 RepID=A0ABU7VW18_9BACL